MLSSWKLRHFAIPAGLAFLNLPSSVCSSQERAEIDNRHTSNEYKIHELQINPQLLFEIKLHGFLLRALIGFLMPVGILVMRKSNGEESIQKAKDRILHSCYYRDYSSPSCNCSSSIVIKILGQLSQ
ncbi:cytochrome b561 domain-containing protein At2g30890-like isoform X2 [Olea europaea var. sylvestris]|uniref:cytochrome b561 domain-containing protein At2g30890-like isoform X2 n=1 Tax=Olea europaea var. sylvestris TaxID=158386 RepID=UPI000C1CE983|nr:cytochrome b561 domain-containing protein At2g30890-like isoform X2 [Olea europaea var. sylvestris]